MSGEVARGIVSMLAAVAAFAVMDASMKHLVEFYPPVQVSCLRGLASIPFFLLGVAIAGSWRDLLPVQWSGHLLRGVLAILMLWTFVYAVTELPLGTAYGIFLCAPLLITAMSALVLHEHVGMHRWAAIACGMVGVVVILNPDSGELVTLGGLAALASALCYSVSALMIRKLARTESTLSIGLTFMVMVSIGTGVIAIADWRPIGGEHWLPIVIMGSSGAVAQYLIVHAFRCAAPSVIAPFEFTAVLWGIALDWVLWATVPSARMLIGATVVIASGLYVVYREHWVRRHTETPFSEKEGFH
jgi:drug/metabolite transporter (DMT)-like permease